LKVYLENLPVKFPFKLIGIQKDLLVKSLLQNNGFKLLKYYGIGLLPHYGNHTILPKKLNTKVEKHITEKRMLRKLCFDVVYVAKKI